MTEWKTRLRPETIKRYTEEGYWETDKLLSDYFDAYCKEHPDQVMVVDRDRRVTYAEMAREIDRLSFAFQSLGLGRGDVVSFQLPNWLETMSIYLACKKAGLVCNPIIYIYRAAEIEFILKQAESKVVFIPKVFRGFDFTDMMVELRPKLPALEHIVVIGGDAPEGMTGYDDLLDVGQKAMDSYVQEKVDPNDVSLLLYTSGTTSEPKGVMHTNNTIMWEAKSIRDIWIDRDIYNIMMATPVTHVGGLFTSLEMVPLAGGTAVFQDVWDPEEAMKLIERERCTNMLGSTPFLQGIVLHPKVEEYDLSSLKAFGCGGAPVPPRLIYRANNELGIPSGRVYGLTELSTITFYTIDDPVEKLTHTDGSPVAGVEVRIVDLASGRDLGPGLEGEIWAKAPECFVGYKNPDLNDEAFDGDWFRTGDLGFMDEDGYLTITGRKKEIIIRSGENISVKEVEDMLHTHPAIQEAAVVGMPDPKTGEKACAYIILATGASDLTLEDIVDFVVEKGLAKQKIPERMEIVEDFPRTHSGKIKKNILKEAIARQVESETA
ncbi:MAG: AMP-binding protein [Proteobacteria bacterium]|nr:AMP-binding protein [Pseudomonadota bacterium]